MGYWDIVWVTFLTLTVLLGVVGVAVVFLIMVDKTFQFLYDRFGNWAHLFIAVLVFIGLVFGVSTIAWGIQ